MKTKQKRAKTAVSVLVLVALCVFSLFAVAGNLEPSAPPGPTMKTLDEVEPRIPIKAADLPLVITEPKSYHLSGTINFTQPDANAITVEANDVTIDLAGYSLIGPGSGKGNGIYMNGRSNVEIRNGTVRDFYYGIYEASSSGKNHRVIDVRSVSNGRHGIFLYGQNHLVKGCTASDNGYLATISVCGIFAGFGCTVTGNTAHDNGNSAGGDVFGILLAGESLVDQNTAYNNNTAGGGTNMNVPGSCTFGTNHAP